MYIRHFPASATVVRPFKRISSSSTLRTAVIMSESLPTPDGSMRIRSGLNCSMTLWSAARKSPVRLQQIQPEFSSLTATPASFIKPPSMPISPNSFSMRTSFSPAYASAISFLISVVLPAPRKPEKISTFTMCSSLYINIIKIVRQNISVQSYYITFLHLFKLFCRNIVMFVIYLFLRGKLLEKYPFLSVK